MPLIKSGSDKARSANIAEMVRSGMPQKQAIAAAFSNQRKEKAKKGGRKSSTAAVRSSRPARKRPKR